jgi:GT2 family glycosyltransferase/SAM-dependent methyltransferase
MKDTLEQLGYCLDPRSQVWIRPGYEGIAYSDGDDAELRIGKAIEAASDLSVLSKELRAQMTDWPSLYHLSSSRANLLRPYKDIFAGDILEIGAGCGAITRYLGEQGGNILALEGSPRRAAIARSRTRDLHNVTVLSEKFDLFITDKTFDVVTLIGVLEYANMFTPGDDPAVTMLRRVRQLLKPNGKLVIAIENQLGLKYFAGAPEDHMNIAMYGLEGRYLKNQPQTFGKKVLERMLIEAGFSDSKFMAPFPDYKLPASIVTEAGFGDLNFDAAAFAWQSARRDHHLPEFSNFSLELTWPEIIKNGLGMELANSFLIVAGNNEVPQQSNILAYHYSANRLPQYCREAKFIKEKNGIVVTYAPLDKSGVSTMIDSEYIQYYPPEYDQYQFGKTMSWEFIQIITKDGWTYDELGIFLKKYLGALEIFLIEDGQELSLNSTSKLLPGEYFDLLPQNIVETDLNTFRKIDSEWKFKGEIELGHLLLRGLLLMMASITRFGKSSSEPITRKQFIFDAFQSAGLSIDLNKVQDYLTLESRIQNAITSKHQEDFLEWFPDESFQTKNLNQIFFEKKVHASQVEESKDSQISEMNSQISEMNSRIAEMNSRISEMNLRIAEKEKILFLMESSTSWRITKPLRNLGYKIRKLKRVIKSILALPRQNGGVFGLIKKVCFKLRQDGIVVTFKSLMVILGFENYIRPAKPSPQDLNDFQAWFNSYGEITDEARVLMAKELQQFVHQPLISVILPVYCSRLDWLREAIESVRNQIYENWQLCIADDASKNSELTDFLKSYEKIDPRIKVVFCEENGHISNASNAALSLASGKWIALLDHDDVLTEDALFRIVEAINRQPEAKIIYSDEAKIGEDGIKHSPYFKCDWNRDLFYSHNLISHLGVYDLSLVRDIGGFRVGLEGSQDHDLALRCIEKIKDNQIVHIPKVLYFWRAHTQSTASSIDAKSYAQVAGERALNDHFKRIGVDANATSGRNGYKVSYQLPKKLPLVSLIIPTRDAVSLVQQCIESILKKTSYKNYEIILIDNNSTDPKSLEYFKSLDSYDNIRVVRDERDFNYSALNNHAVKFARGEIIGLINNDIEVITPEWLSEMVSLAIQPQIGAVGAKLLYPDNTIQHAGVILGLGGVAEHGHKNFPRESDGYFGRASVVSSFSAVTGACLLIKKSIFSRVGGLNEQDLAVAFNDVDFCLRVRELGLRNVWTPYAELYHHESATRGSEDTAEKKLRFQNEVEYMMRSWAHIIESDPAYSPNLSLKAHDFSYAWPPRV